jgi:hypothetical protein
MNKLQEMFLQLNPYANVYKTLGEVVRQNPTSNIELRLLAAREGQHTRRYNVPGADEVAVILPGNGSEDVRGRDIVLRCTDGTLQRVNEIHPAYNALQYPLLFPRGEDGWHTNIPLILSENSGNSENSRKFVTMQQYISYYLMMRQHNYLLQFKRLFLQFVVDNYARIEQLRLNYLRLHQEEIRADSYIGAVDAIASDGDVSYQDIGRRIILPSSFIGSPRHMHEQYQDAMAIVRHYRKPDLFITITCNPKWDEITQALLPGQTAADRPDIVVRVFRLKFKSLLDDILKKKVLGRVEAYVYTIEFQKRGLPHAHLLIILDDRDKPRTPEDYDRFVQAEIPNPRLFPLLHQTIITSMLHGPCSEICLDEEGKCIKGYPKEFQNTTQNNEDGYPLYRRRDDGSVVHRNGHWFDNKDVVPYNSYLAQKYNAHINVEICSSVKSVKYLFKYVHKGCDMINAALVDSIQNDEIAQYMESRYIAQCEAVYRIFQFRLSGRQPAVIRLAVHEENYQQVMINANTDLTNITPPVTTLLAFFNLNVVDPEARDLLYHDIPRFYTYNKNTRKWTRRRLQQHIPTIGRMYFVSPRDVERYCLRQLLLHVTGPTSYEDLRRVGDVLYLTFHAACLARGLLETDEEWEQCIEEAANFMISGDQLRQLFATILLFGNPSNPAVLWERFRDDFVSDYTHQYNYPTEQAYQHALYDINRYLEEHNSSLQHFPGFPTLRLNVEQPHHSTVSLHTHTFYSNIGLLNQDQRSAFDLIANHVAHNRGQVFFVEGVGGSGKTFLYNSLIAYVNPFANKSVHFVRFSFLTF